jgi:predicted Zn-dependent peptidase
MREFYSERDVIAEERRMRTDDDPEGRLYEQFMATAVQAHPYRIPIVGWMSEVQQVTADDALRFRERYYIPSNAVGVIVGNVDIDSAKALIERYFGRIPASRIRAPEVRTAEPPQIGERRIGVTFDAEPQMMIGFHKPNYPAADAYVFAVIANILRDSGASSRLYRRLVKPGIASEVSVYEELPGQRYPNIFTVQVAPAAPHTTQEIEAVLYTELDSLGHYPVSDFELTRCKNQLEASYIRGLANNDQLAQELARAQAVHGDWRLVGTHRDGISRVTAEDIMRVARTYFIKSNRTVATLVRPDAPADQAAREGR